MANNLKRGIMIEMSKAEALKVFEKNRARVYGLYPDDTVLESKKDISNFSYKFGIESIPCYNILSIGEIKDEVYLSRCPREYGFETIYSKDKPIHRDDCEGDCHACWNSMISRTSIIKSAEELEEYIQKEYDFYDTELNSLFFDVEVFMKQADILEAYRSIQSMINGDAVVRLVDIEVDADGKVINGEEADSFIPEGMYEDIYSGNCKEFLEKFNGKESVTGFCRYDGDDLLDFIW